MDGAASSTAAAAAAGGRSMAEGINPLSCTWLSGSLAAQQQQRPSGYMSAALLTAAGNAGASSMSAAGYQQWSGSGSWKTKKRLASASQGRMPVAGGGGSGGHTNMYSGGLYDCRQQQRPDGWDGVDPAAASAQELKWVDDSDVEYFTLGSRYARTG